MSFFAALGMLCDTMQGCFLSLDLFGNLKFAKTAKLVLSEFVGNVLFYSVSIFISHNQEVIMERRHRAFTKNDTEFKELFGVKKEVFHEMLAVLTEAREKRRRKGGPRPKLSVGDQLLLTLQSGGSTGRWPTLPGILTFFRLKSSKKEFVFHGKINFQFPH
ncbi:MAG: hypothetical protein FWD31_01010 [Planctomycetaceae bacterium]|nr:hypothetical protein [Planctomycetaceae bacterium]